MCRNIKTLFNCDPPATDEEVRAASLQFVRKLSGSRQPSQANAPAVERAVDEVTAAARRLLDSLERGAQRNGTSRKVEWELIYLARHDGRIGEFEI